MCIRDSASTISVDTQIADAGLAEDLDTVSEDLGFTNIHYYAAAATQYGTLAMGGYQYGGNAYDARFDHVPSHNTCIECHNPHTLEINLEQCQACHTDAATVEDLADIRMFGSLAVSYTHLAPRATRTAAPAWSARSPSPACSARRATARAACTSTTPTPSPPRSTATGKSAPVAT